ncbi:MAG: 2-oxoacid:acceptor oxidoreductase subunit alpha [Candidatus Melainabacteria bacterium]
MASADNMAETINHFSWTIGGPQGTGVDSSANLFLRACAVAGLYTYGKREYHSTIKNDHSYFQVRVSETPINSHVDPVHLLTTFEKTAALVHDHEVVAGGAFIYDPKVVNPDELNLNPDALRVPVPYDELLKELADEMGMPLAKVLIMKNTLAVGASLAMVKFDLKYVERALKGIFTGRKEKLVPANVQAAEKAYNYIKNFQVNGKPVVDQFQFRLDARPENPPQLVMTGTTAVALGKLKAGCKFQTYYPITPASDESVYLESVAADYGMNVVQCEDEISSACMAVGGALTGVRSATSTSCPGFGLMAEGLGWAAINEVPVVFFDYQRGGPATGLPTRHEQGDLMFARFISHGDPPRIVVAPGDMSEYFEYAFHAFNYADEFQTPVVVLTDKCAANNTMSIPPFAEDHLVINRGKRLTDDELAKQAETPGFDNKFKRYAFTEDGISPMPVLGQPHGIHWKTGDEHDEYGHICEEPENRIHMMNKRAQKMKTAAKAIPESQQYTLYGPENAEYTILTWGSTKGPILDALPILQSDGISINVLQVRLMAPFPVEAVTRILSRAKVKIGMEMNHEGQLAALTRMETGIAMDHKILKWTGRPISETEAVAALRQVVREQSKEVVLSYGH